MENVVPKKKQPLTQTQSTVSLVSKIAEPSRQSLPPATGLYVKQVPRRSKSPFKKYERAAIESLKSSTSVSMKTLSNSASNISNSDDNNNEKISNNKAASSILFPRKEPINNLNEVKDINNMKLVNNFEDLVIALSDTSTVTRENNLICYKKKYLLNLTGGSGNSAHENGIDTASKITEITTRSAEVIPIGNQIYEHFLCSKCKKELTTEEVQQNKMVHFKEDLTADLIECLRAEDRLLRKKVAEGDSDPMTFKRLERLAEVFIKAKQIEPINAHVPKQTPPSLADKHNLKISKGKILIQKQKRNVFKSTQVNVVSSLSDSAFSNDLKNHPLIRNNPYFYGKF